jgi:hypothetical protein
MPSTPIMIKCRLNGNVVDIENNSTTPGTSLDAFPPKVGESLNGPATFAANQTWEVLPDPAGSSHHIIKNPATGLCIDIHNNSTSPGAALEAWTEKTKDNQNQLWDFLPDPFGSEYFFIQNPQTGYVIEVDKGSSKSGASLLVNPRRLFDNSFQLWAGVQEDWAGATFPALTLASPTADLKDTAQYVLLPTDQTKYLTGITVTLDVIDDLVADSFSVQINGAAPYPPPKGVNWTTQMMQFVLVMQNNSLALLNQIWHAAGPDPAGNPLPSVAETSPSFYQLKNNTVPAGTRIVLTLATDQNDYVTSISGQVYVSGALVGQSQQPWSVIGQPTFHGGPVQEANLAPLGSFQVVVVGAPGGHAHFTAGMGTITVKCAQDISAELSWPNPSDPATGETSNCYYGKVQTGNSHQIVQPFGLPSPKMTSVSGDYTFAGNGLLPNSKLTASALFRNQTTDATTNGIVFPAGLSSQNDGSFSLIIEPQNPSFEYAPGTLTTTVKDTDGNWATGVIPTDVGFPSVSSSGGLHE